MASSLIHKVAQAGFGAGTNELYDRWVGEAIILLPKSQTIHCRSRPTYQPFSLDFIRESLNATEPINIVEYLDHRS